MDAPQATQNPADSPDFVIVGPLRAGTTMFRLMIGHHPKIAEIGEFEESVALMGASGFPTAEHYKDWLATHRVAQSRDYALPEHPTDYQSIVHAMWTQLAAEHHDARVIGCTIHSRIDRVLDLWPNTKLICLVRDPRDVCRSCVGMGWFGHPAAATSHWLDPINRWESARDRLPPDRWTTVRYEDLLNEPERELSKCTELLGLEYDPTMLSYHESTSYERLDPNLAEQWRRKMHPRTAEIIDARCTPKMQEYNYAPSTDNARDASWSESCSIKLSNRLGRLRWRINRYGLPLVLSWAMAKRLPITNTWRRKVQRTINTIDHQHLR